MRNSLASRIILLLGACGVAAPAFGQNAPAWPAPSQTTQQTRGIHLGTSAESLFAVANEPNTYQAARSRPGEAGVPVRPNQYSPVIHSSSPVITSSPQFIGSVPALVSPAPSGYPHLQAHGPSCGCSSCAFPGGVAHRSASWFAGAYGLVMTRDSANKE